MFFKKDLFNFHYPVTFIRVLFRNGVYSVKEWGSDVEEVTFLSNAL